MVQDSVISRIGAEDFIAYVVWEPILKTDDERASRKASALFSDGRVKNYWTPTRDIGNMFRSPIHLTAAEPAWDVYLVYEPGVDWNSDVPPEPTYFMHQMRGRLPADRQLDGPTLRDVIARILAESGSR